MDQKLRCTEEDIKSWLVSIFKQRGIDQLNVEVSGTSERGDGYLGDVNFVKVRAINDIGKNIELDLVVKCGKTDKHLRETTPVRLAFENEVIMYDEVLPLFLQFQKEKGISEPFDNVPKCYGTLILEDMEVVVLENLKSRDFVVMDRTRPMEIHHIRQVVALYAKLHAISFALRDQQPQVFRRISQKLGDVLGQFKEIPRDDDYSPYKYVIEYARDQNEQEAADKVSKLEKELLRVRSFLDYDNPYAVILHGDCWNNNFMFMEDDKALDVRFLDWQLSRLASPVQDLSYFLFTNLSPQDTVQFDQINDWYYDNFCQFLRQLGSDPDKMFPYEQFLQQWRTCYSFGMHLLPDVMRICLSEKDEIADLADLIDENVSSDLLVCKVKNFEEFGRRCLGIVQLIVRKGFI